MLRMVLLSFDSGVRSLLFNRGKQYYVEDLVHRYSTLKRLKRFGIFGSLVLGLGLALTTWIGKPGGLTAVFAVLLLLLSVRRLAKSFWALLLERKYKSGSAL